MAYKGEKIDDKRIHMETKQQLAAIACIGLTDKPKVLRKKARPQLNKRSLLPYTPKNN